MTRDANVDRTEIQEGGAVDAGREMSIVDMSPAKVPVFTGETLIDDFANRIETCWHKTTEGIIEVARVWANADDQLNRLERRVI
jgi:hypothetical protein